MSDPSEPLLETVGSAALLAQQRVDALLNPRNIAIVGASDKRGSWSTPIWQNLLHYGFGGAVYPVNPARDTVWGTVCYRDFAALPEPPDQLLVLVPAPHVADALERGAAAGARSATVFTSGFDEASGDEGKRLGKHLREVIVRTGLAVSGPNCLGTIATKSRLVTMTDRRPHEMASGPVAIIGQSGGVLTAIKRTLNDRGVRVGYLVTSGNEAGLTAADYVYFFAAEPDVKVIVCYVEALRAPAAFLDACRTARTAGKPVVVVKLGGSEAGRAAAQAHTGALAGALEAFDAVAGAAGAVRARNLDDLVEIVELFLHAPLPAGLGLGAITFSGGLRGLLLDGGSANGVAFPELAPQTRVRLEQLLGVGTIIGNPLDAGFAALSSQTSYLEAIRIMLEDPGVDLLLLQEEISRGPGLPKEDNLHKVNAMVAGGVVKPVAFVSMISYGLTDYSRSLRDQLPRVAFLHEVEKSLRAAGAVAGYAEQARCARRSSVQSLPPLPVTEAVCKLREAAWGNCPAVLDEALSKALLRDAGLPVLTERITRSADEAVAAAQSIGFPVVLKILSADVTHKSDAGGVRLALRSSEEVRRAYDEVLANIIVYKPGAVVTGVLVAPYVTGGLELALGLQNDPDMGCVVMFGMGGVWLELFSDVAFGAAGLDIEAARALIGRTRAGKLLDGYRGKPAFDRDAVEQALVALGRIARDFGDLIETIDVNPFVALERGRGGYALDGLVIARRAEGAVG